MEYCAKLFDLMENCMNVILLKNIFREHVWCHTNSIQLTDQKQNDGEGMPMFGMINVLPKEYKPMHRTILLYCLQYLIP